MASTMLHNFPPSKAARSITRNYLHKSRITAIKYSVQLPSHEKRRLLPLLYHFHQLPHTPSSFAKSHIKPAHRIFPRLEHPFNVRSLFDRGNLVPQSPLFVAVFHWNGSPKDIGTIHAHDLVLSHLKRFLCIDTTRATR